jgi:hypothetical protein
VTDDTSAIQSAINAATSGGVIFFPTGRYVVSSLTINLPVTLRGSGIERNGDIATSAGTVIVAKDGTSDVIIVQVAFVTIEYMGFDANVQSTQPSARVPRTGGAFVHFTWSSNNCHLANFFMYNAFYGVIMGSKYLLTVQNGAIFNTGSGLLAGGGGSTAVLVTGDPNQQPPANFGGDCFISKVLVTSEASVASPFAGSPGFPSNAMVQPPSAGIWVQYTGALNMTDCLVQNSGAALYVTAGQALYAINCLFDTSAYGILLAPVNYHIQMCHFIGCWTSTHANHGVLFNLGSPPANKIDSIQFINHHAFFNGTTPSTGSGMFIQSATNITVTGGDFSNNGGPGITIDGNSTSDLIICHNRCGLMTVGQTTQHYPPAANSIGILVAGSAANKMIITHNDLTGNVSAGSSFPTTQTNCIIGPNIQ